MAGNGFMRPAYEDCARSAVVAIWKAAGLLHANNDPFADIDRKVADSPWDFPAMVERDDVIGTVMFSYASDNVTSFGLRLAHDNGRRPRHTLGLACGHGSTRR